MANKKRLVYAEDILYELMQYENSNVPKSVIKRIINKVAREREVAVPERIHRTGFDPEEIEVYD